jgi:signal transduction histidine kinase/ligand-binding sensor domain-containing protein
MRSADRPGGVVSIITAFGWALLAWCPPAFALNPALDIGQYGHAAWTIREGFLNGQVLAIAQTPDGYLWLGTETGLFRFDGSRMVRWQPREHEQLPSPTVAELLVARDGRLWIGTYAGLASLKGGRLVTYPELAGEAVGSLVEDSLGTVWAGTIAIPNGRLCAIRAVVQCTTQDGRFGNGIFSLFDDRGTLWLAAATGLWRWTPGNPTRYATPLSSVKDVLGVSEGPLLIATIDGVKQLVDEKLETYRIKGIDRSFQANKLLLDRDGGLWIGTFRNGLIHAHQERADVLFPSDGLSGDSINVLFEDRERNIWVGTNEGLDRFRELPVTTVSSRQGLPSDSAVSVLPARDGSVWIGSAAGPTRWKDGQTTTYSVRDGLPDNRAGTMFEDSIGRVLVATMGGMAAFDNGRFVHLKAVPTRVVYNIVEERTGDFWISDQEQGLLHLVGEEVVKPIPWSALGHADHATALVLDGARRGLWLGFYNGGVAFVQDGTVGVSYGTAEGLAPGRISDLRLDEDGALWAATAGGLTRLKDNHIATLTTAHGLPCEAVHWTILDVDRALWLLMPCGLARISSAEVAAWVADPHRMVTSTLFDNSDGARALSTSIGFNPAVARLADGRLWFATANGVGAVDPRRLSLNALPPPVHIQQMVSDRKTYSATMTAEGGPRLPPLTRDLQIDYTALSLVAPEKVRFRYKLEGRDRDWRDAGNRRQAFYNDLAPGSYRFRVIASNNSGVWNETGATVDFAIAPAYYQTTWFPTLAVGMLVGVVWAAHRIRVGIVEKHEREISALNERLMKAQEQERIRIAGELHDGVMQEMLAATMMLGTAKRRIAAESDAKATIEKVQEKLIRVGTDIRQLSHDLHPPVLHDAGLPQALRTYCEQFTASSGTPVACDADDDARDLSRGAALALFRIVQEALGNAAKHAHARQITVRLTRSGEVVSLVVSDAGVGFDTSRLGTSGGLGLIMMRERAGQLNGKFEFESAPGRGTTIKVTIPFR